MKKIVLGFDVSSTTCGWCALEIDQISKEIKYLESGYHKPIKTGSIVERVANTRKSIL